MARRFTKAVPKLFDMVALMSANHFSSAPPIENPSGIAPVGSFGPAYWVIVSMVTFIAANDKNAIIAIIRQAKSLFIIFLLLCFNVKTKLYTDFLSFCSWKSDRRPDNQLGLIDKFVGFVLLFSLQEPDHPGVAVLSDLEERLPDAGQRRINQ